MPIDFTLTLRTQKYFPKAQSSPCCGGRSHKATKVRSAPGEADGAWPGGGAHRPSRGPSPMGGPSMREPEGRDRQGRAAAALPSVPPEYKRRGSSKTPQRHVLGKSCPRHKIKGSLYAAITRTFSPTGTHP